MPGKKGSEQKEARAEREKMRHVNSGLVHPCNPDRLHAAQYFYVQQSSEMVNDRYKLPNPNTETERSVGKNCLFFPPTSKDNKPG